MHRVSALLVAGTLAACAPAPGAGAQAAGASTPSAAPASPWVPVGGNAAIRVSLDTSRIAASGAGRVVWLAFDLAEPWPPMEDIKAPYRHYEARQEVECAAERARGRAMRFVDVQGTAYAKPAPDSTWTGFSANPLTPAPFRAVCGKLAELGRS